MTTSHFYHGATEDSHINSRKNGWFGHKLQMCELVWTKFFVMQVGHDGTQGLMTIGIELGNFGTNLAFELHMFIQNLFA